MIVGVPKEIKVQEFRVSLTPQEVKKLANFGHEVRVEKSAGKGSGFSDSDYKSAGARVVKQKTAWSANLIIKVKEPLPEEFRFFRKGQIIFTFLHLASAKSLSRRLKTAGVTAIDYATIQLADGSLPLLRPMSEISGKVAIRKAAQLLEAQGKLLGGTFKTRPYEVVILGGGTVGTNAAEEALGMDARVIVMDSNPKRVARLDEYLRNFLKSKNLASDARYQQLRCEIYNRNKLASILPHADVLIGAALIPGAKSPHLVTKDMVKTMRKGSLIVDVSIDQGGCVETSRKTTHKNPTFIKYGVTHYCIANIPGSVPHTSTLALAQETLRYILLIAGKGLTEASGENSALAKGVNIYRGKITHPALADTLGQAYCPLEDLL